MNKLASYDVSSHLMELWVKLRDSGYDVKNRLPIVSCRNHACRDYGEIISDNWAMIGLDKQGWDIYVDKMGSYPTDLQLHVLDNGGKEKYEELMCRFFRLNYLVNSSLDFSGRRPFLKATKQVRVEAKAVSNDIVQSLRERRCFATTTYQNEDVPAHIYYILNNQASNIMSDKFDLDDFTNRMEQSLMYMSLVDSQLDELQGMFD